MSYIHANSNNTSSDAYISSFQDPSSIRSMRGPKSAFRNYADEIATRYPLFNCQTKKQKKSGFFNTVLNSITNPGMMTYGMFGAAIAGLTISGIGGLIAGASIFVVTIGASAISHFFGKNKSDDMSDRQQYGPYNGYHGNEYVNKSQYNNQDNSQYGNRINGDDFDNYDDNYDNYDNYDDAYDDRSGGYNNYDHNNDDYNNDDYSNYNNSKNNPNQNEDSQTITQNPYREATEHLDEYNEEEKYDEENSSYRSDDQEFTTSREFYSPRNQNFFAGPVPINTFLNKGMFVFHRADKELKDGKENSNSSTLLRNLSQFLSFRETKQIDEKMQALESLTAIFQDPKRNAAHFRNIRGQKKQSKVYKEFQEDMIKIRHDLENLMQPGSIQNEKEEIDAVKTLIDDMNSANELLKKTIVAEKNAKEKALNQDEEKIFKNASEAISFFQTAAKEHLERLNNFCDFSMKSEDLTRLLENLTPNQGIYDMADFEKFYINKIQDKKTGLLKFNPKFLSNPANQRSLMRLEIEGDMELAQKIRSELMTFRNLLTKMSDPYLLKSEADNVRRDLAAIAHSLSDDINLARANKFLSKDDFKNFMEFCDHIAEFADFKQEISGPRLIQESDVPTNIVHHTNLTEEELKDLFDIEKATPDDFSAHGLLREEFLGHLQDYASLFDESGKLKKGKDDVFLTTYAELMEDLKNARIEESNEYEIDKQFNSVINKLTKFDFSSDETLNKIITRANEKLILLDNEINNLEKNELIQEFLPNIRTDLKIYAALKGAGNKRAETKREEIKNEIYRFVLRHSDADFVEAGNVKETTEALNHVRRFLNNADYDSKKTVGKFSFKLRENEPYPTLAYLRNKANRKMEKLHTYGIHGDLEKLLGNKYNRENENHVEFLEALQADQNMMQIGQTERKTLVEKMALFLEAYDEFVNASNQFDGDDNSLSEEDEKNLINLASVANQYQKEIVVMAQNFGLNVEDFQSKIETLFKPLYNNYVKNPKSEEPEMSSEGEE